MGDWHFSSAISMTSLPYLSVCPLVGKCPDTPHLCLMKLQSEEPGGAGVPFSVPCSCPSKELWQVTHGVQRPFLFSQLNPEGRTRVWHTGLGDDLRLINPTEPQPFHLSRQAQTLSASLGGLCITPPFPRYLQPLLLCAYFTRK